MKCDDMMTAGSNTGQSKFLFAGFFTAILLVVSSTSSWGQVVFPGRTYEQRRQAYIDDQGEAWEQWFPGAMKEAIWAWLERPAGNTARISEEIGYLTSNSFGDDCDGGWKNCWFTGDHQVPIQLRIYLQYYKEKKVISDADAAKLKAKLREVAASPGIWGGVANYFFRYLVTGYLYDALIEDLGAVFYPEPSNDQYRWPPPFTYGGRRYVGGKSYDASQIYSDFLNYMINEWLNNGTQEDFGPYYYAQVHSMAALADFAPEPVLKKKGEMFFDFLVFNWAIGFSANHSAGGHGRHYVGGELTGQNYFPFSIFFDRYGEPDIGNSYSDAYVFKHRFPQFLTDIVEMKSEGDDYYRIIRGNTPAMSEPVQNSVLPMAHRYDFITKNYNLGGTNFGTGWELNIKADKVPMKMWMEWADSPNSGKSPYLFNLGLYGYQHRNAIFYAGSGHLLQKIGNNSWDEQSTESAWKFFRKGNVAVAATIQSTSGALEVATIGVDYPSFEAFKTAIKTRTQLTTNYFKTSKGVVINKGYVDYGPEFSQLPFDRLEVWDGHVGKTDETKVVDWHNNVMTISKYGETISYDFNNWKVHKNDSGYTDLVPPEVPTGIQVKAP